MKCLTFRLSSDTLCECPGEKTGAVIKVENNERVNAIPSVVREAKFSR